MPNRFICFALLLALLLTSCIAPPGENELVYTLLDLDGAESAILQCGQKTALIDCGYEESFLYVATELDRRGIQTLDVLVLTHPHDDHVGGALKVIRHYRPSEIWVSETKDPSLLYPEVCRAATENGITVRPLSLGETVSFGQSQIRVLSPASGISSNENNLSLVLKVRHCGHSLLLTADAETAAEMEMLLQGYDLSCDVLKVAHHGSAHSTSEEFAKAASADFALFSVPEESYEFHPSIQVQMRLSKLGAKLYFTDEHGDITVRSTPDDLTISTEK